MSALEKTRAIVLRKTPFRETSLIIRIYTEEFGLQSGLINGVRSANPKSSSKAALFQPLSLLDLVMYYRSNAEIQRIAEAKVAFPFHSVLLDSRKAMIVAFLQEILLKTLQEENPNPDLFDFLFRSITDLERLPQHIENFHLQFLLQLAGFLGFQPTCAEEMYEELFDHQVLVKNLVKPQEIDMMNLLLQAEYGLVLPINYQERNYLLEQILRFYNLHIPSPMALKSLEVLQSLH